MLPTYVCTKKRRFYLKECNSQHESSLTVDSPTTSSIGGNHPLGLFPFQSTQSRRISPSTSPQLHHSVHDGKAKIEFLYWYIRVNQLVGVFLFGIRFLCRVQTWTSEGYMVSRRYYIFIQKHMPFVFIIFLFCLYSKSVQSITVIVFLMDEILVSWKRSLSSLRCFTEFKKFYCLFSWARKFSTFGSLILIS